MKAFNNFLFLIIGAVFGGAVVLSVKEEGFFNEFFQVVLISLVSALLSFFLEFCFREGNIFAGWIRFLARYFYENRKNPFRFLYKPLGGCSLCMNIWLTSFCFCLFNFIFVGSWIFFLWFIPSLLFAHLILFFTFKHFDFES